MTKATRAALQDVSRILQESGWDQHGDAASPLGSLYESDETAWLEQSSRLIRQGRLEELDYMNLAAYLEDMSQSDRRQVVSRLETLLAHLLKWRYQPEKRTKSWRLTVFNQRRKLKHLLTGTLRRHAEACLADCYATAVDLAALETDLPKQAFPAECPFTLDQALTQELA